MYVYIYIYICIAADFRHGQFASWGFWDLGGVWLERILDFKGWNSHVQRGSPRNPGSAILGLRILSMPTLGGRKVALKIRLLRWAHRLNLKTSVTNRTTNNALDDGQFSQIRRAWLDFEARGPKPSANPEYAVGGEYSVWHVFRLSLASASQRCLWALWPQGRWTYIVKTAHISCYVMCCVMIWSEMIWYDMSCYVMLH